MTRFELEIAKMNEPELESAANKFVRTEFWSRPPVTSKLRGSTMVNGIVFEHDACSGECPERSSTP